jgi:2-phosphosulfolactate phosphatase
MDVMRRSQPLIHIVSGKKGVAKAREHSAIVTVVDVLCASSTLIAFFANGGSEAYVVDTVEKAFLWKKKLSHALLSGEKLARPILGFDLGFTPLDMEKQRVSGKTIVFTSTNGAMIMTHAAQVVSEIFVGAVTNSRAVAATLAGHARRTGHDLVIIPAGVIHSEEDSIQWEVEDWIGACWIAHHCGLEIHPESMRIYTAMCERIRAEGFVGIFTKTPLGDLLIKLGLGDVVRQCATEDCTDMVVRVVEVLNDHDCGMALRLVGCRGD